MSGNGSAQTIRIVSEASTTQSNGRGAMIDNIAVTEVLPVNTGYKGSSIRLSSIVATASDTDGSENVSLQVSASGRRHLNGRHAQLHGQPKQRPYRHQPVAMG